MSDDGHDLHRLFPDDAAILHQLKLDNAHFRTLAERHHGLEREIHRIEAGIDPASDERAEQLKKERLAVLDQINVLIAAGRAEA